MLLPHGSWSLPVGMGPGLPVPGWWVLRLGTRRRCMFGGDGQSKSWQVMVNTSVHEQEAQLCVELWRGSSLPGVSRASLVELGNKLAKRFPSAQNQLSTS